jgi:hypothetical protein
MDIEYGALSCIAEDDRLVYISDSFKEQALDKGLIRRIAYFRNHKGSLVFVYRFTTGPVNNRLP